MMEEKQVVIEVQDLTVSYGRETAVAGLSLSVDAGEWVLITGPSGCGKSTLARTISGLIPHHIPARVEGRVRVGGMKMTESSLAEDSRLVGMVFQNPETQLIHLSVVEELVKAGVLHWGGKKLSPWKPVAVNKSEGSISDLVSEERDVDHLL